MSPTKEIEKAALTVNWPTCPVNVCIEHGEKLVALRAFLGTHVGITPYAGEDECINCVNEAKKR